MANPSRVAGLLEMAAEDLAAARLLAQGVPRQARYHVQQAAEKTAKALLEHADVAAGRDHGLERLALALPEAHPLRDSTAALDRLSPAATTLRYPTATGRILPPPHPEEVRKDIDTVAEYLALARQHVGLAP